jgi:hypothetical protein
MIYTITWALLLWLAAATVIGLIVAPHLIDHEGDHHD